MLQTMSSTKTNKSQQSFSLDISLSKFKEYLHHLIFEHSTEFDHLSRQEYLGCFCSPDQKCHVDLIIEEMRHQYQDGRMLPKRQCIKVSELRKAGYQHLKDWNSVDSNIQVTRNGRIFITHAKNQREIYHYPNSLWANPFKVMKNVNWPESLHLHHSSEMSQLTVKWTL